MNRISVLKITCLLFGTFFYSCSNDDSLFSSMYKEDSVSFENESQLSCNEANKNKLFYNALSDSLIFCPSNNWSNLQGLGMKSEIACSLSQSSDKSGYTLACGGDSVGVILIKENTEFQERLASRTIQNTPVTYEGGENYCSIIQPTDGDDFKIICGNNVFESLNSINLNNVNNGEFVLYKQGSDDIKRIFSKGDMGSFVMRAPESGTGWSYFEKPFIPSMDGNVKISFKVRATSNHNAPTAPKCVLWLSNGGYTYGENISTTIGTFEADKDVEVTFNPSYYKTNKNPSWEKFNVWFAISAKKGYIVEYEISDLQISQVVGEKKFENFNGKTSDVLLAGIDSALSELNEPYYYVSPSGYKYELSINDDGTFSSVPLIPSKAVYFGNSVLTGSNGFGMAASSSETDYYNLVNTYIRNTLNKNFTAKRFSGYNFEMLENPNDVSNVVKSLVSKLDGNENLVVVQLGDNVNNVARRTLIESSSIALLSAIRNKCKNAKVVWMGLWYSNAIVYNAIKNACEKTGSKFISFSGIDKSQTSYLGAIQKLGLNDYILEQVKSVSEVEDNIIEVSFEVPNHGINKSKIPVNNWSLSGSVLKYRSEYCIVSSVGVAGHPGDSGFKLIANRFLLEMNYSKEANSIK